MADKKISALTGASTPLAGTEVLPIVQSGTTVKVAVSDLTAGRAVSASDLTSGVGGTGNTTAYLRLQGSSAANYGPAVYAYRNGVNKWFIASESDYLGGSGDNPWVVSNGTTLNLAVASTGATAGIKLTSTEATFTGTNVVIGTSGKGIDFSATPGTGTSELLADYEEGTWTPSISYSTSNGDRSVVVQVGRYTKVGNIVTVQATVSWSESTASGNVSITGLPFTSVTLSNYSSIGAVDSYNLTGTSGGLIGAIGSNATTIALKQTVTGNAAYITQANTVDAGAGGQYVYITCTYQAA
jgi:hypothetical protein